MADNAPPISVVIYEQEYLLGLDLAQQFEQIGVNVVAMRNNLSAMVAEIGAGKLACDAVILDINAKDASFPQLVGDLERAGAMVVLMGTSVATHLPTELRSYPYFPKPIVFEQLAAKLRDHLTRRSAHDND